MPNRLADSASLYLRQHADNPVEWQEWGPEAWETARRENKPVFLSVGYSSCHWCHVMAHESFEDDQVAAVLNRYFVNIKLDREERPDVDEVYMTATQMATGHGGWPMSVFLTPDQKPFFVGTYFPKNGVGERPGFLNIATALGQAWEEDEKDVRAKADEFAAALQEILSTRLAPSSKPLDVSLLDQHVHHAHSTFDYENGGFGDAPKFPPHAQIEFLLEYAVKRHLLPGDATTIESLTGEAAHMACFTLERMAMGGLHDHVGGGFHRYATDETWTLPHFEKMLYDNAQMLRNYSRAAKIVQDAEIAARFRAVADRTAEWMLTTMRTATGLLAASIDADTAEGEGVFYTWMWDELAAVSGEDLAKRFNATPEGNAHDEATGRPTGRNILFLSEPALLGRAYPELVEARDQRTAPVIDPKAVLGWNALAVSALVEAGRREEPESLLTAWWNHYPELPHTVSGESGNHAAFLDDYAYLAEACAVAGHQWNDTTWTARAGMLVDDILTLFGDESGRLRLTSADHEELLSSPMPVLDGATPSALAFAARAARLIDWAPVAGRILSHGLPYAYQMPSATASIATEALELLLTGESETLETREPWVDVRLSLTENHPSVGEDGWAWTALVVEIPEGHHLQPAEPDADYLTPTSLEVTGVYGEADFDPSVDELSGRLEIPVRLKPRGEVHDFALGLTYQLCSQNECYAPKTVTLEGSIQSGQSGKT